MIRLVSFELRKMLIRRVWLAIVACLVISAIFFIDHYPSGMNSILAVNKQKPELIAAHLGPVRADLAERYAPTLKLERAEDSIGTDEEKIERIFQQKYASAAYLANLFDGGLNELRAQKILMESQGQEGTYIYKDITKQLGMMERLDPPGFYVTTDWDNLFRFMSNSPATLFIGFVLVLALAPLYAGEASYRMDALILSSRYGRRNIVAAKLLAGLLFTVGWVTAFYGGCALLSCMPFGFVGWDAPLNSYLNDSPYAMTQLQGFLLQYAIALMGSCGLLLLTALISAAFRSSFSSLGFALVLVILPLITFPGVLGKIMLLFPTHILASRKLIESYKSFNLFNNPVLYLPLSIIVMVILGIVILVLIPKAFERRLKV
ncbi:ABC transporter permease subunit [Paenibacillus eucommiae]|uniref:ABC-type transport system involved in multi-copper enzyme maturation permease subunit n=1 Tax=Paenibacillus eucommiae TaxID=1355755 RepID=A0ABS4J5C0_9BACL|nr:ABC transporter permease subunit [Paenibacillus eucommiae]MBP1994480.1 ABC-type transport system involved in multi-copper enzyme maturation permease subunit [Paenibacillus eucommiae]